jgi:cysteine desulfurase
MDPIYLDYAATTPVRAEVREAMAPFLSEKFGNPSSIHRWGREAREALESAREEAAATIGASPAEVTFVRGGTESDNMALLGWCDARAAEGVQPRLAISAIEHHAVLEAAERLAAAGHASLFRIDVGADGTMDLEAVRGALADGPALVSVMWVNNELGMLLPIRELAELVAAAGGTLHSDAAQAVGKVPVSVADVPVDLLSGTGHKIYGPKGTGFLFVREGTLVTPLLHGGGQEHGLRPGTQDVAGAVGLATAMRLAVAERETEAQRLCALRRALETRLTEALDGLRVNAGTAPRAPHVSSIAVAGVEDGSALVMGLDLEGIAVSGGSACTSGATRASHVIQALYGRDDASATVRFSLGRETTEVHLPRAVEAMVRVVGRARAE